MDCKFAYTKGDIPYILCKKEKEPTGFNKTELFHAVCIHQAHCPRLNCHKLTPEWINCMKLTERAPESAQAAIGPETSEDTAKPKTPSRSRRKPQTAE